MSTIVCPHCGGLLPHDSLSERLWNRVNRNGPLPPPEKDCVGNCWEWVGDTARGGYGRISVNGKQTVAHRIAYMLTYGPISDDICVCHKCDNRLCVRPEHLFLGTMKDNVRDMHIKGRNVNGGAILTSAQVSEIRKKYAKGGYTHKSLGLEYGVSKATIKDIITRRTWKST